MVALLPPLVARPSARTLIHSRSERTLGAPARRQHARRFYNTFADDRDCDGVAPSEPCKGAARMNAPTSDPHQLVLCSARWVIATRETLVRVAFGTFMGGLVLLLILPLFGCADYLITSLA